MSLKNDSGSGTAASLLVIGAGLLLGLLAGGLIFFGLPALNALRVASQATAQTPAGPLAPAPVVGAPAPDFVLTDLEGRQVRLSDFKGQVVLLNFWATWCSPCQAEMPAIEDRYATFKSQGLVVLGINQDEDTKTVQAFVERLGLTFTILLDPGAVVGELYRARGLPTTFIVDRDGKIIVQKVGFMSDRQLDQYLSQAGLSNP
ncbi:MAG: redoxin domain-containing protein [Anaerolineales bacterium]|nr:redoxin domain-containing protein [Anaerolineales bacterium]